jgi:hypothetical protein
VLFDPGCGVVGAGRKGTMYLAIFLVAVEWGDEEVREKLDGLVGGRGELQLRSIG